MKTGTSKEDRDRQAASERKVTKIASAARQFLAAYDEFFPESPYAISETLEHLIEAVDASGDEVGTIHLRAVETPEIGWGVWIENGRGHFKYWLMNNLTPKGASSVIKEAESFFGSIGLRVVVENPW